MGLMEGSGDDLGTRLGLASGRVKGYSSAWLAGDRGKVYVENAIDRARAYVEAGQPGRALPWLYLAKALLYGVAEFAAADDVLDPLIEEVGGRVPETIRGVGNGRR